MGRVVCVQGGVWRIVVCEGWFVKGGVWTVEGGEWRV